MVAPFSKFYGKIWVSFCLKTGEKKLELLHPTHTQHHVGNYQQESHQLQSKNQPIEIKKLKIKGIKLNC